MHQSRRKDWFFLTDQKSANHHNNQHIPLFMRQGITGNQQCIQVCEILQGTTNLIVSDQYLSIYYVEYDTGIIPYS